jgi:hypothetical protein
VAVEDKEVGSYMYTQQIVRTRHNVIEWSIGGLAVVLPVVAWFSSVDVSALTLYDVFPPLGLIAFGLMWTHYIMGALRRYFGAKQATADSYMTVSMGIVLGLIILHPLLLWIALYNDGFGLPPGSYMQAYESQLPLLALGTIALLIFLAYELKRFFGGKRWWKYIEYLQIIGMVAIFIHAIGLGNELRIDWMMAGWIFYGITLLFSFIYSFMKDKKKG